jgi:hypothetical protein
MKHPNFIVFFSAVVLQVAQSLPNGAPTCDINPARFARKHAMRDDAKFQVVAPATYTAGGPAVQLQITAGGAPFQGLLAYVMVGQVDPATAFAVGATGLDPAATTNQHVGKFDMAGTTNIRAQTDSICQNGQVQNEDPMSTITHAGAMNIDGNMNLMWTPPVSEIDFHISILNRT